MRITLGIILGMCICIFIAILLFWIFPPCCCNMWDDHVAELVQEHEGVVNQVPEPGTLALVFSGLAVLLAR